jgi:hypothetical protein
VRPRILILIAALLAVLVGGAVFVTTIAAGTAEDGRAVTADERRPAPARGNAPRLAEPPAPAPDLSASVSVDIDGFLTWAARDRTTGEVVSSGHEINSTESMIKVWVAADHLRRAAEAGREPSPDSLTDASLAIRDSNNEATQRLYAAGGYDEVVERMIDHCGLTDTEVVPGWWSRTMISAEDAVRLGECVADGTAAGPQWTDWLLEQMRQVQGTTADKDQRADEGFEGGRWGIIDGLPPELRDDVAIKNGWTRIGETDSWHLNCLAVTDDWVLAVLMRYPAGYSLDYGADRCAGVASQLFDTPAAR